ncbi:ATP-grasp domain-containing protein [Candidatus Saccharibacteria bacterium]|nr:ATP-grasp domain-containing protein [Candidatus Saccharibacteria bacterium]
MSHVLIIGKKFSTLTDYLIEKGHDYTLLQDTLATKFPDKKFKRRVVANFSSKQSLLNTIDALKVRPDAVISTYENYILPAAWIAEHLGVLGLPIATAEACTDKFLMRSLFDTAPEKISPAFATVTNETELRQFASDHSFPLILKPANLAKSLLVTKSSTLNELVANYMKSVNLLQTTYKKYAPNRRPKLIIEEFLEGSIHSVDAFVDARGIPFVLNEVVDYQTGYDIGYDDNFHYSRIMPSSLLPEDVAALRHCATIGITALGMKNSAAHVEIIMTKEGPRIVEIGARNGGYRERMHGVANGIDITGIALDIALGKPPVIHSTRHDACAVLELFPLTPGVFQRIDHESALRNLPSLHYLSIKAKQGAYVGKSADGYKMCAVIMLHNQDQAQFDQDLAFINQNVKVITH